MRAGLVLLSARDTDAPALPLVATVSKEDQNDDGGFGIGVGQAAAGAVWCDRPYATGNPTDDWALAHVRRNLTAGCHATQLLNELNLELEGWQGGPGAYADY